MKRNIALFTGVAAFVLLFYKQEVALNLSIFCLLVWGMLFITTDKKYQTKTFWLLSIAVFVSIAGFAWYGDFASFVPLFFSMLILGFKARFPRLNILTFPVVMALSYITSPVRMLFVKRWLMLPQKSFNNFWTKLFSYFLIPLIFFSVFLGLYSAASEKFASYIHINWNLNFLQIVFLSVLGFFFMFNFFHIMLPRIIIRGNSYLTDQFSKSKKLPILKENFSLNLHFQRRSGEITLVLLNLLILVFTIIYTSESIQNIAPTESYSSEVHERVYVIIASIVIAVAVIMIYFHFQSNFAKEGKLLRTLSYIWITLNAALVIIAIFKTADYVNAYGLTFKRIGVYAFLVLCLVGLVITSYKLIFIKTNVYLLNRMVWVFFVAMVVGFNINWSWVVTQYNITHKNHPDIYYLNSLEFNKEIMYKKFGDNLLESYESETITQKVNNEKSKPFLSKNLYYQFLNLEK